MSRNFLNNRAGKLPNELVVFFDGSIKINPGSVIGYSWIIKSVGGVRLVACKSKIVSKDKLTNNIAEWMGITSALRWLHYKKWNGKLTIYGDSQLVINQLTGKYGCRVESLKAMLNDALLLLKDIDKGFKAIWIPRAHNKEADRISR